MAFVAAVVGPSLTFVYGSLKDGFQYIKHRKRRAEDFSRHFESLKLEVLSLRCRWNDTKDEIDRNSADIETNQQYTTMLKQVTTMLDRHEEMVTKCERLCGPEFAGNYRLREGEEPAVVNGNGRITNLSKMWSCKFFKLARLDKDVENLKKEVELVTTKIKYDDLIRPRKPKIFVEMEAKELGDVVPSHQRLLEKLQGCISNGDCKRIGIWGEVAGVGTSNIMKNLNNWLGTSALSLKLDYVIWVTVPTDPLKKEGIVEGIQDAILHRLEVTGQNRRIRKAEIISEALREKSYVLLFDGFFPSILLEEIGIFEDHARGKVVIENKFRNRLKRVTFDESIEVPSLPIEDSRKLFDKIIDDPEFCNKYRDLSNLILKELGGLPGVIEIMAEQLKATKTEQYWIGKKKRLQADVFCGELLGLAGVKQAFEMAYDELVENVKKCLLYAALFPKEFKIPINVLVECWKAEEFLWCPTGEFYHARAEGEHALVELTERKLLQNCTNEHVKMPINFRRVALYIPFPGVADGTSYVWSGHLKVEEWEKARRVSLVESELVELPEKPKCQDISTLLLQLNPNLRFIHKSFFRSMQKLRVLDLHNTGIVSLPNSISYLTALRSLYLNNCVDLKELPPEIACLKKLEVLDIQGTKIHYFPKEISSLVSLRCLRFSFLHGACNPNQKPKSWKRFLQWLQGSPTTQTWLIFSPKTVAELNKLEELTIVLLISTGSGEDIEDQIRREVRQFKYVNDKVNLIRGCSSQSRDQGIHDQPNQEEINLLNPSDPDNAVHDLVPGIQSPGSNDKASRNRTGKGIVGSKLKNRAHGGEHHDQQGNAVELPNFSAGASTSGTADRAD